MTRPCPSHTGAHQETRILRRGGPGRGASRAGEPAVRSINRNVIEHAPAAPLRRLTLRRLYSADADADADADTDGELLGGGPPGAPPPVSSSFSGSTVIVSVAT